MDKKLKLGFIGAGWWATEVQIPYFASKDNVELVAVCRLGKKELENVKDKFSFQFATEDYKEFCNYDLDAVVIASPHIYHFEHAKAALEAGKHVLIEKPMTTEGKHAFELIEIANSKGLEIVVPQAWSFAPWMLEAKQWLNDGGVGEVKHLVCQMASALADLFDAKPMLETLSAEYQPPISTWADPQKAGGYGWGQLSHALGVMFNITNLEAKEVYSLMGLSSAGVDYYDAMALKFVNGATASLSGSATIPKASGNDRSKGYQIDIRIFGSEGMLLLDIERERLELVRNDGNNKHLDLKAGDGDYPQNLPLDYFVEIVLNGKKNEKVPAVSAAKAVAVLEAAYKSAKSGNLEEVYKLEESL